MAFCCWRQSKTQDEEIPEHLHPTWPRRFSLSELQVATSNFSNKNILGRGGFGTTYKGRLLDGSLVAVRISKQMQYFQTELNIRGIAIHRNLLCLRGFCVTPSEQFLVYPYMVNGNLASCLQDRLPTQPLLNWSIRKHIALEVARGLAYLHDDCNPKIIHRNVKAANILLDEEFEVVIQGFELAKFMDRKDTDIDTIVCGTFGYIAPEYLCSGKLTEKIDVFAYGVMLLELVTGHRAFDLCKLENDDDVRLLDWVKGLLKEKMLEQLVDCDMDGNYIEEEVEQLIQVALLCTQGSPTDRPKMSDVIRMLQDDGLHERWEKFWQKEEMFDQDFTHGHDPRTSWVTFDSISNIQPDELTSPR